MCSFQTVLWVEKKVQQPAGRFLKHLMLFSEGFGSVTVAGCTRCWRSWAVPCLFILTIKVQCLLCVIDVYTWCLPPMRSGEGRAQLGSYWSVETSCKVTSVKCFTCRAACGAKICCSFAWLGLSSEKLMLSRRILRRLPDVNVIEFFILYFEPLLNVSLGKVLKKTEQKMKWEAIKSWQPYSSGFAWEGQKCALSLIVKNEITRLGPCPFPMEAGGCLPRANSGTPSALSDESQTSYGSLDEKAAQVATDRLPCP